MAADQHRRQIVTAAAAARIHIADLVDFHVETGLAAPGRELISGSAIFARGGQTANASTRESAYPRQIHMAAPQTIAVDL
jgi:hypothetical protein